MKKTVMAASVVALVVARKDLLQARSYLAAGGWDEVKEAFSRKNLWSTIIYLAVGVPPDLCGGVPSYGPGSLPMDVAPAAA